MTEDQLRSEMVGCDSNATSRGSFMSNLVLCGHATCRMQLFLYLESCRREELNTINLWRGYDPPVPA